MRFPSPIPAAALLAFSVAGCTSQTPASPNRVDQVSANLAQVKMPVLRSSHFEKAWGKPDVAIMSDGNYRLRYRQEDTLNFVIIESLARLSPTPAKAPDWEEPYEDPEGTTPPPAPHPQEWRRTSILGQPVRWYQNDGGSGADFPCYKTVDFALTAPDGRSGFYRISVCSDSTAKAATWIHQVSW